MLKDRNEQIQLFIRTLAVFETAAAFFISFWVRAYHPYFANQPLGSLDSVIWLLGASLVIHFVLYPACRFYESIRLKSYFFLFRMVFQSLFIEVLILSSLVFLFQVKSTSRFFFLLFLGINYFIVLCEKLSIKFFLSSIRRRGYNFRQVLIVGTGENARAILNTLKKNAHWGYVPFGVLREVNANSSVTTLNGVPVLGTIDEFENLVLSRTVDEVYFALDQIDSKLIEKQLMLSEKIGIPARFSFGFFDLPHSQVSFHFLDRLPILTFYTALMTPFQVVMKRCIDLIFAVFGLFFTALLFPFIYLGIKLSSSGPIIFKQPRVGENGRRFKCYKFRTMVLGADEIKKELIASNEMSGPMFKIKNDPRIFKFGAFLRRTSLDELPQFYNIFRGEMSIVGTRPPTPDEVDQYELESRRRLSIKPGLTGLWQVSGRSKIKDFKDVVSLDLQYIDEWSIWLDFKIIFKTVWVVLFQRGAG